MAYTTINKSTDYFNTKLYTGNASTLNVTGVGFQPDWTWIKSRSGAGSHNLFDAVRGVQKRIFTDLTDAEQTSATYLTAFGSDGFTLGNNGDVNGNSQTTVAWNWKANGAGSSNTDGDINSTVSVNQTAGFSIVKYTGNGSNNQKIGHGLNAVPKMIITKPYSTTGQWYTYHASLGATKYLDLVSTAGSSSDIEMWNNTTPTNSVFTVGVNGNTNGSGKTTIAYCFAPVAGYSVMGSYFGNNNNNGPTIYTGMKPKFIFIKKDGGTNWMVYDSKRLGYNANNYNLVPNTNSTEDAGNPIDILSNGFKIRNSDSSMNGDGSEYIYMAIGQSLVGTNGVTAKAR